MQTVKTETKYIHPVMSDIARLYGELSDIHYFKKTLISQSYDLSFEALINLFKQYGRFKRDIKLESKHIKRLDLPKFDSKNIIVCMSGGKDSLASVLHYMKLGYNVTLFHVAGINRGYYGEEQSVLHLANALELPVYIDRVSLVGNHSWIEHPMKNMIIANLALTYGIQHNITTKIAFGNFTTSALTMNTFGVCGGDCPEMWRAYENIIKRIIPAFRIYVSNHNSATAFNILKNHTDLIPMTLSCITPYRFRRQFKERTEKNHKITLMENRCGCCYKCAIEYIRLADLGVLEFNQDYYEHCLIVLRDTIKKEEGVKYVLVEDVWDSYISYSIKKSKIKGLRYAVIRSNKVQYNK